jgi:hypothetical protein
MSKSQNPLTGHMSGSMANFTTYTRYGENIIRAKAFDRKDARTVSQIAQRASFKLIVNAYKSFGGIPMLSFKDRLESQSIFNAFVAANLPEAINKSGAVPVIDYSKLLVSRGTLLPVVVPTAEASASGITVTFKTDALTPGVSSTDEVVALAKTKTGELIVARQVRGSEKTATILIPYPGIAANMVECCFLFALNEDGSNASDSTYVAVV